MHTKRYALALLLLASSSATLTAKECCDENETENIVTGYVIPAAAGIGTAYLGNLIANKSMSMLSINNDLAWWGAFSLSQYFGMKLRNEVLEEAVGCTKKCRLTGFVAQLATIFYLVGKKTGRI